MTKTEEVILKTVRRIEDHQASQDRDMEKDRQDLQNLSIKVATLVEEMTQLRKAFNTMSDRTKEQVVEATKPITKATDNLASKIAKSKTVIFGEPKKTWWIRLIDDWGR